MIQPAHSNPPLVVYGAGDHGLVVADAARAAGLEVLGFVDDADLPERNLLDPDLPALATAAFVVGIGDNAARLAVARRLLEQGKTLVNVLHPDAAVSPEARLGRGVFVGAQAVVGPEARLEDAVLVNSAAVAEHHCVLEAGVHLAPAAALGGRVKVGQATLVGLGAKVLPGVTLGKNCVVGAGAVVVRDAGDGVTLRGVPARTEPRP